MQTSRRPTRRLPQNVRSSTSAESWISDTNGLTLSDLDIAQRPCSIFPFWDPIICRSFADYLRARLFVHFGRLFPIIWERHETVHFYTTLGTRLFPIIYFKYLADYLPIICRLFEVPQNVVSGRVLHLLFLLNTLWLKDISWCCWRPQWSTRWCENNVLQTLLGPLMLYIWVGGIWHGHVPQNLIGLEHTYAFSNVANMFISSAGANWHASFCKLKLLCHFGFQKSSSYEYCISFVLLTRHAEHTLA